MKTETNTRYHIQELDEYVEKTSEEIMSQCIINAENYAAHSLPPPDNTNIKSFFLEEHQKFQSIIDEINRRIQVKTSIHEVAEHKKATENKLRDVRNQQSVAKEKGNGIDAKLRNRKPPYSNRRMLKIWAATTILTLFDGIYNKQAFVSWGSSTAEALLQGLFLAFLVSVIAHCFKWITSHGKTRQLRVLIGIAICAVMACLFTYMAIHRTAYLQQQAAENSGINIPYTPVPFALVSMLIFGATIIIHYRYFPSPEQRAEMREYKKLVQEKCDNEATQKRLKADETIVEREHLELRQKNASIIEYGKSLESVIISKAHQCMALFKRHNLLHRKDNHCPASFEDDTYVFSFTLNFQLF